MNGMALRWLGALAVAFVLAQPAWSQPYPARPVKIIVPYSPGGLPDTVARVVGQALSDKWGQHVIVENKPGGNGLVAAPLITSAPPDGYTLLVTDGTMFSVNLYTYKQLPYDPQKDFTFITMAARAPLFLAVNPSLKVNTFEEFLTLVKAAPGKYSYGSSGIGSVHHLTTEMMKAGLGLDMVHVPYKGTGQSVPALVSGDVAAVFSAMPSLAGFVKDGRLKLIAVNTEKRSALAPQIPTVAEFGLPGFEYSPHIGFSGPAGMPPALVHKIAKDVADVVKSPAMAEKMTTLGIDAVGSTPEVYAAQHAADRERYGRAVKTAGIKPE
jgi:tripartite-type tricarboxylate transporter receptor subunit TctC